MESLSFGETIYRALLLDAALYRTMQQPDRNVWLGIVCLAALSTALAQSPILLLNRVPPLRLGFVLLMKTLRAGVGYLLWLLGVWLVVRYGCSHPVPLWAAASVIGLALTPQLLRFLTLMPFFGPGLGVLLALWSVTATVVAVYIGLGLELAQAVATGGASWLLVQAWQRTVGRPLAKGWHWLESQVAGVPLEATWQNVPRLRPRAGEIEQGETEPQRQHRPLNQGRVLQPARRERSHA